MNNNYYSNKILLPPESALKVTKMQNKNLNEIEIIGLKFILSEFIREYETGEDLENYYSNDIINYLVTEYDSETDNKIGVSILDGYANVYLFDTYALKRLCCTKNGILYIECYVMPESGDITDLVNDLNDDKEELAYFKLN